MTRGKDVLEAKWMEKVMKDMRSSDGERRRKAVQQLMLQEDSVCDRVLSYFTKQGYLMRFVNFDADIHIGFFYNVKDGHILFYRIRPRPECHLRIPKKDIYDITILPYAP